MVGVNVENDRDIGGKFEIVVLKLTRLAYENITLACNAAAADTGEFSANVCREVDSGGVQYLGYH